MKKVVITSITGQNSVIERIIGDESEIVYNLMKRCGAAQKINKCR
jgi:ABC-type Zn uptake system ZnuABC Zn-binding protein ZnuA